MAWPVVALVVGLAVGATAVHVVWRARAAAADRDAVEQRAEAEAQSAAQERPLAEMRAALDALPEGVVVVDACGGLVVRNRQAEHFLGVTHLDALVDEAVESHLRDALAGRERVDTLEVYGPPRRTLVVRGSVVSVAGQQVGALSTIEDVSDRARLESVRTDLVANLSHELKTPVGAIALLAETLADLRNVPGRWHELTEDRKGQISVDLDGPYRLILVPVGDEICKPDGGLDWNLIQAVCVQGVEDTHE
jgi:signal transduction histidine kinase